MFNRWLDRLDPQVEVVLVMVQCYAGGFANAIFHRHDPDLGLAPHRRCGFFAQVHDRGAAGCTPEANEADYQEYSTFFWAALAGQTRLGDKIDPPDYDESGQVSLAEAHAYAVIESDTIDIPTTTSEAVLRNFSRLGREAAQEDKPQEEGIASGILGLFGSKPAEPVAEAPEPLIDAAGPLADLHQHARADQLAIIQQLTEQLELVEPITVEAIRFLLTQTQGEGSVVNTKYYGASSTLSDCESDLKRDVCELWPELSGGFSPMIVELTGKRAAEFVQTVEALPSYAAWASGRRTSEWLARRNARRTAQGGPHSAFAPHDRKRGLRPQPTPLRAG